MPKQFRDFLASLCPETYMCQERKEEHEQQDCQNEFELHVHRKIVLLLIYVGYVARNKGNNRPAHRTTFPNLIAFQMRPQVKPTH